MLAWATWTLYLNPEDLDSAGAASPWLTSLGCFPSIALWSFSISAASPSLPEHLFLLLAWLRSVGAIPLGPDHPSYFILPPPSA